jgi:hypothetical protein
VFAHHLVEIGKRIAHDFLGRWILSHCLRHGGSQSGDPTKYPNESPARHLH